MEAIKQLNPDLNQLLISQQETCKALKTLSGLTNNSTFKQLVKYKSERLRHYYTELKEMLVSRGEWVEMPAPQRPVRRVWNLNTGNDTPENLMPVIKQYEEKLLTQYSELLNSGLLPPVLGDLLRRQEQTLALSITHVSKLAKEIF